MLASNQQNTAKVGDIIAVMDLHSMVTPSCQKTSSCLLTARAWRKRAATGQGPTWQGAEGLRPTAWDKMNADDDSRSLEADCAPAEPSCETAAPGDTPQPREKPRSRGLGPPGLAS